jgi:MFS transporter, DHA1 family, multidrug resistance protein
MAKLSDSQEIEPGGVLSSYQFLTLYFPAFILSLGYSIATPAIPVFAKSFDTGFGVASLVIVVHALGGLIAAVPTGFLVDHLGRRPMLFAGPVLMATASVLTAVAQSFPELLVYRFLGGGAMEMWRQARLAIIADVSKSRQRGRQMSGMVGTEGAAKLLGPAVGGVLATWSIRTPFLVHGALAFLAIVPSFFLVRESAPVGTKDAANKKDHLDTRALLAMMLDAKYRGFFAAQFFATMTRGVLWGGTLLLYAAYAYDAGPQLLGGLATTTTIVGIPITLSCGYLMDRFGRKTTMVPGFVCMALGLIFLASSAQWQWSLASFIAAVIWTHAGQSVTAGSMQVLGSDMAPAVARGRFFGFWRLIGEIGGLVSPALFALVAEQIAYSAAFALFALCSLGTAALLTFSVKETVGRGKL